MTAKLCIAHVRGSRRKRERGCAEGRGRGRCDQEGLARGSNDRRVCEGRSGCRGLPGRGDDEKASEVVFVHSLSSSFRPPSTTRRRRPSPPFSCAFVRRSLNCVAGTRRGPTTSRMLTTCADAARFTLSLTGLRSETIGVHVASRRWPIRHRFLARCRFPCTTFGQYSGRSACW
jgi:hypothetical protein